MQYCFLFLCTKTIMLLCLSGRERTVLGSVFVLSKWIFQDQALPIPAWSGISFVLIRSSHVQSTCGNVTLTSLSGTHNQLLIKLHKSLLLYCLRNASVGVVSFLVMVSWQMVYFSENTQEPFYPVWLQLSSLETWFRWVFPQPCPPAHPPSSIPS